MIKEAIFIVIVVTLVSFVSAASLPEISSLPDDLVACENSAFSHNFEVSSPDSNQLEVDISPKEIFFVGKVLGQSGKFEIFSGNLSKALAGKSYERTVYGKNEFGLSFKKIKINVSEVNNPPTIEDVRVQTVSLDNGGSFSKKVLANDSEDGNQDSGKLGFDIKFKSGAQIFTISNNGLIEFSADKSKTGVYLVEVCARDSGLEAGSYSSACGENGAPKISCDDFQLTVTESNRQPTIVSRSPSKDINTTVGNKLNFTLTTFDADGTSPDVYWYVDGRAMKFESGLSSSEKNFNYGLECNSTGVHEVKAEVSDGLAKDSVIWRIYVKGNLSCVEPVKNVKTCEEKWGCSEWNVCQHSAQSEQFGSLPSQDYQKILLDCNSLGLSQEACGFQIRTCADVASCKTSKTDPIKIQACKFVLNPSCSDEVRNCHDSSCEIGIDCGGTCGDCPSCIDRIKNQGEEGVDCGGPCATACPTKESILRNRIFSWIAIGLVVFFVVLLLFKTFKIFKFEKEMSKYEK
jgi:hypothetical protein